MFPISDSVKSARFPFINLLLIAITVYVFFRQIFSPNPEDFTIQYALIPANVDPSDLTTLLPFITSMFLHGGFLHIASNMLFLWVFGDNVEGHLPPFVYLFLYIGAGLVGGITQYVMMPDSTVPMLGASGAVAGALGAYFALFPHHKIRALITIPPFITTAQINAGVMLGYWILLQLISAFTDISRLGDTGGIAFFAHIGGFFFGFLFAKLFPKRDAEQEVEE